MLTLEYSAPFLSALQRRVHDESSQIKQADLEAKATRFAYQQENKLQQGLRRVANSQVLSDPSSCQSQLDDCLECYKQHSNDTLRCFSQVRAYRECAARFLPSTHNDAREE